MVNSPLIVECCFLPCSAILAIVNSSVKFFFNREDCSSITAKTKVSFLLISFMVSELKRY